MPVITYIQPDGVSKTVEAEIGVSLMALAKKRGIAGILGECGGVMSCGTCHIYVDPTWTSRLPAPKQDEHDMLEFVEAERLPESRLSCQIRFTEELDGLTVRAAPVQQE